MLRRLNSAEVDIVDMTSIIRHFTDLNSLAHDLVLYGKSLMVIAYLGKWFENYNTVTIAYCTRIITTRW